jgi:hypothetical protein
MADPMQYTGYTYGSDLYRQPTETLADYMQRLAAQRATGVLGGGGMLDTPTPITETDPVLGTVTQSCPAGFTLQNGACVRISRESGMPDTEEERKPFARTSGNKFGYVDPMSLGGLAAMIVPAGGLFLGLNNAEAVKAAQQAAGLEPTGFFNRLGTNPIEESIGTKTINGKDYQVAIGGGVVDKPSVIETVFGSLFGSDVPQGVTSLTPAEAMRRSQMANYMPNIAQPTATTYPVTMPTNFLAQQQQAQEAELQRTMGMMDTLNQLESGAVSGGNSGYYSDSSGNYTGGADYGGWTGVTADGSGNDWNSF